MDAHRVEVLDAADDDRVVVVVAHHLHLVLLPAQERAVDEHLRVHRRVQPPPGNVVELVPVVRDAPAGAAERERRPHDRRQADLLEDLTRLFKGVRRERLGALQPDRLDNLLELLAVLGPVDHLAVGPDHLHTQPRERPVVEERARAVERRLPAQRRQHRVDVQVRSLMLLDDLGDGFGGDGLDVRPVRELRVGHDRRRVGVHQHHLEPFLPQGLARLRARVVELTALADDDRPGADEQDGREVGAFGHTRFRLRRGDFRVAALALVARLGLRRGRSPKATEQRRLRAEAASFSAGCAWSVLPLPARAGTGTTRASIEGAPVIVLAGPDRATSQAPACRAAPAPSIRPATSSGSAADRAGSAAGRPTIRGALRLLKRIPVLEEQAERIRVRYAYDLVTAVTREGRSCGLRATPPSRTAGRWSAR